MKPMKTVFLVQFCYYDNWVDWSDWQMPDIHTARYALKNARVADTYGYVYRIIKRTFTDEVVT